MATKKSPDKISASKKEYRKTLAGKIESVLPELKIKLGDKEFQHRIKKATKLFTHGWNDKSHAKSDKQKVIAKNTAKQIKVAKKAKAKKQATADVN